MTIQDKDAGAVEKTLEVLCRGGVVLVPTETVYGLVGDAGNPAAAETIYRLKHRPKVKRLGFFASGIDALDEKRFTLDERARRLAGRFWPGPLTLILPDAELGSAGIRVPDHVFLQEVLRRFNGLLFQTSANLSGMPDARDVESARAMLAEEVDLAVDGGALAPGAAGSTIVDLTVKPGRILRQGALRVGEDFL